MEIVSSGWTSRSRGATSWAGSGPSRRERFVHFRFEGTVEGRVSVSGRLVLERYNLADTNPDQAGLDARMIVEQRSTIELLTRGIDIGAVL